MDRSIRLLLGFGREGATAHEDLYLHCALRRLEGLGVAVTVSDPTVWDRHFNYAKYDVVALLASCNPVKDPVHLLSLVTQGSVGFLVFGAWNAAVTLQYLGLLTDDKVKHQSASHVYRTREEHFITSHLAADVPYDFGVRYISCAIQPGLHTRVLLHVDGDAALVVHTKLRACICHWTADPSQHAKETVESVNCTKKCILWAAGCCAPETMEPPRSSSRTRNPFVTSPSGSLQHVMSEEGLSPYPTAMHSPIRASSPPLSCALIHPSPIIAPCLPCLSCPSCCSPAASHPPPPVSLQPPMAPTAKLAADLNRLIDNPDLSDVAFVFAHRRLYANQAILSIRCGLFREWIEKEKRKHPCPSKLLEIHVGSNISYEAFRAVVAYLYTAAVPDGASMTTLINVLVTSQDCGLRDLQTICEDTILGSVDPHNVVPLLIAANQLRQMELKAMALDFIRRHMAAVRATGTMDQLRAHPELMLELLKS